MKGERGGIVLGWIFRIIVLLAILALTSFEAGAIIVARVTADRVAIDAAADAGHELSSSRDLDRAKKVADADAAKDKCTVTKFTVTQGGRSVEVTVQKKASTFLVQHIGFLKRYATATSTHTGLVE